MRYRTQYRDSTAFFLYCAVLFNPLFAAACIASTAQYRDIWRASCACGCACLRVCYFPFIAVLCGTKNISMCFYKGLSLVFLRCLRGTYAVLPRYFLSIKNISISFYIGLAFLVPRYLCDTAVLIKLVRYSLFLTGRLANV